MADAAFVIGGNRQGSRIDFNILSRGILDNFIDKSAGAHPISHGINGQFGRQPYILEIAIASWNGFEYLSSTVADGRRKAACRAAIETLARETATPGLWVAPATLELASTEVELFTAIGREMVLRDALSGWADRQFDVAIIDSPPTLGLLTINSLVASSRVIIPVQTQYYAIKGLTALIKVINTIKLKLNHDLEVLGLLPTFYDGRTVLAREMLENLKELGDHRVFNTMIKNTVKLGEAPLTGRPVTEYATNSSAAQAFRDLAKEVIELG